MSLTIKHNIAPALKPCVMACDKPLSKHLDMYELSRIAFNKHATSMIIGRPGSGKSSFIQSLFCKKLLKGVYNKIFLFQPPTSRGSAVDDVFHGLPTEQVFDELTIDNLEYCLEEIESDTDSTYLIILDDMGSCLKQISTLALLKKMMMNKRHMRLSIMFLCQTYYSQNKEIRRLFNNYFVFKTNIADEVLEIDKDIIPSLAKLVYDKPYNYLYINVDARRLFKNFDEIIIEE
jgi:energy-coupling factor transporter ATP-binding protein EcfA2